MKRFYLRSSNLPWRQEAREVLKLMLPIQIVQDVYKRQDAYRVPGHDEEFIDFHNIHVVFTKTAETADHYIEKFAHENGKKYNVTVATSDGVEQVIIRGQGCLLISCLLYTSCTSTGAINGRQFPPCSII